MRSGGSVSGRLRHWEPQAFAALVALSAATLALWTATPTVVALRFTTVLMIASLGLAAAAVTGRVRLLRHDPWLAAALAGCVGAIMLSTAASPIRWDVLTWGFGEGTSAPYWIACLVVFGVSALSPVGHLSRRAVSLGVALLTLMSVIGVVQRQTGTTVEGLVGGGSNYLGPLVAMGAPVALGLARTTAEAVWRWSWRGSAALLAAGALLTGSGAGAVALIVVALVAALIRPSLLGVPDTARLAVRVAAYVFLALTIGAVVLAGFSDILPSSVDAEIEDELFGRSTEDRLQLWRTAAEMVRERPLSGWGPDGFTFGSQGHLEVALMARAYAHEDVLVDPRLSFPQDAHSFVMSILSELGLVGGLAFLLLGVVWCRQVLVSPPGAEPARDLRASFALGALAIGVSGLAVPWSTASSLFPVTIAGLAIAGGRGASLGRSLKAPLLYGAVAAFLVLSVFLSMGFIGGSLAAYSASRQVGSPLMALDRLERAVIFQPNWALQEFQLLQQQAASIGHLMTGEEFIALYDAAPSPVRRHAPFSTTLVRMAVDADPSVEVLEWGARELDVAMAAAPAYPESFMEAARIAYMLGRSEDGAELWSAVQWAAGSGIYRLYAPRIEALAASAGGAVQ